MANDETSVRGSCGLKLDSVNVVFVYPTLLKVSVCNVFGLLMASGLKISPISILFLRKMMF